MLGFAGIILTHDSKLMIFKRADTLYKFGGHWSIPSGHREEGETYAQCAVRETFEETQIKIDIDSIQLVEEIDTGTGIFAIYHYDMEKLEKPTLDFEHTEWGLVSSIDNLTPIQPAMRDILNTILTDIK